MAVTPIAAATSEFARPIRLDTIGDLPRTIGIAADDPERGALAARFGLTRLDRLEAEAVLTRDGDHVAATGTLSAELVQPCVATGADIAQTIREEFALRFIPEQGSAPDMPDEVELDAADLDTIGYAGGAIDLGEAVAQTLALALDPFPRAPDADAMLRDAGVVSEAQAGPFAKLLDLKDRLAR